MLSAVRTVCRRFRAEPGLYLLVIVCLSSGIGAATSVFTVVDASLFRPLAYPEPDELVSLAATLGTPQRYYVSPANFIEIRDRTTVFRSLAAINRRDVDLSGEEGPVRLTGAAATPDLFDTLGVLPVAGRSLRRGDEGAAVAVVSEGAWQRLFGADPQIIGRSVTMNDQPAEIVGVVADATAFPTGTEMWLPYRPEDATASEWHGGSLMVVGRLEAGRSLDEAGADVARVDAHLQRLYPANNGGRFTEVTDLREPIVRDTEPLLALILAAVTAFLLAACANVAAVMMVRAGRERWRVAVRKAMGATAARVAGEAVVEGLLLGIASAAIGMALAATALPLLSETLGALPPGVTARVADPRVLAAAVTMSLATVLLFTALPAWMAHDVEPHVVLSASARGAVSATQRRLQAFVVGGQAAFSVLLLLVAAGTVDRLLELTRIDPGFAPDGAMTLRIPVSSQRYPDHQRRTLFFERIGEALRAVPGVAAAGAADVLPIGDPGVGIAYSVEDHPPDDPTAFEVASGRLVIAGYFEALGIPLVAGRTFVASDRMSSEPVAVVSRHMADLHWPGQDPVGKRVKRRTYTSEFPWLTVVGVVDDVRDDSLEADTGATLYLSYAQHDTRLGREMSFVVKTERAVDDVASELRAAVAGVDARAPIVRLETTAGLIDESLATVSVAGRVLAAFAAAGLLLMGLGVYGVVARFVQTQRREVGTRIALGAQSAQVVGLVLRRGGTVLAAGAAAGFAATPLIARLWSAVLGEPLVVPSWAYPLAAILTLGVGTLACLLPSARAARIDPTLILRGQ